MSHGDTTGARRGARGGAPTRRTRVKRPNPLAPGNVFASGVKCHANTYANAHRSCARGEAREQTRAAPRARDSGGVSAMRGRPVTAWHTQQRHSRTTAWHSADASACGVDTPTAAEAGAAAATRAARSARRFAASMAALSALCCAARRGRSATRAGGTASGRRTTGESDSVSAPQQFDKTSGRPVPGLCVAGRAYRPRGRDAPLTQHRRRRPRRCACRAARAARDFLAARVASHHLPLARSSAAAAPRARQLQSRRTGTCTTRALCGTRSGLPRRRR